MSDSGEDSGRFVVGEFSFEARPGGYDVWSLYSPRAVASVEEPIPYLYDVHLHATHFSFQSSSFEDVAGKLRSFMDLQHPSENDRP